MGQCEARRIAISHQLDLSPLRARQRARFCLYHDDYITVVFADHSVRVLTFKDSDTSDLYPYTDTEIRHPYTKDNHHQKLLLLVLCDYVILNDRPLQTPIPIWKLEQYRLFVNNFGTVTLNTSHSKVVVYNYVGGASPFTFNGNAIMLGNKKLEEPHNLQWFKYITDGGNLEDAPMEAVEDDNYPLFLQWCISALQNRMNMTKSVYVEKEDKLKIVDKLFFAQLPWTAPIPRIVKEPKEAYHNAQGSIVSVLIVDATNPCVSPDLRRLFKPDLPFWRVPFLWQKDRPVVFLPARDHDPFQGFYRLTYRLNNASYFIKIISQNAVFWFDTSALLRYWESYRNQGVQFKTEEERSLLNMLVPITPDIFLRSYGASVPYQVIEDRGQLTTYVRFLAGKLGGTDFVRS